MFLFSPVCCLYTFSLWSVGERRTHVALPIHDVDLLQLLYNWKRTFSCIGEHSFLCVKMRYLYLYHPKMPSSQGSSWQKLFTIIFLKEIRGINMPRSHTCYSECWFGANMICKLTILSTADDIYWRSSGYYSLLAHTPLLSINHGRRHTTSWGNHQQRNMTDETYFPK